MKRIAFLFFLIFSFSLSSAQVQVAAAPITVALDGSGNFKTIQEAINSVRDLSRADVKIYIKKGTYNEKLVIPSWKTHIHLIGEDKKNTIITGDDFSGKPYPSGNDLSGHSKFSTFTSYTVLVEGNDFKAENLTIQNTAGRVGQAVALHVEGDRAVILNCRILGNQDTLYTATGTSRQYYKDCYIEGTTDFIFGEATVVFQNCTIKSLSNSYITAAATTPHQKFGYVFLGCQLISDPSATKVFLGRPWRPHAQTVFIDTEMGAHIVPEGWNPWKGDKMFPDKEKTTLYAEYKSFGPGSGNDKRVDWSKQLSKKEIKKYTLKKIFSGQRPWVPDL